jgi:uncharacterized protein YkwD
MQASRSLIGRMLFGFAASCALLVSEGADADALSAVQVLRAGGCGGVMPIVPPLRRNAALDRIARQWAGGSPLPSAAASNGFDARTTSGVHVQGPDRSLIEVMRRTECHALMQQSLRELGAYQTAQEAWLVLAGSAAVAPSRTPAAPVRPSAAPTLSASAAARMPETRALELVNEVRSRGARCGAHSFAPAPPLRLSGTLDGVAFGHAADMAQHNYFEHEDLSGHTPADRVRATGYREKLVGENIAYGPKSTEEVVQGWLDSPGHCENIMDPRFAEMGIAYAAGQGAKHGLYWVQVLAAPQA